LRKPFTGRDLVLTLLSLFDFIEILRAGLRLGRTSKLDLAIFLIGS